MTIHSPQQRMISTSHGSLAVEESGRGDIPVNSKRSEQEAFLAAVFQTVANRDACDVEELGTSRALSLLFAVGKIRGTLRMRSHISYFIPLPNFLDKSFVFKSNGAKEGLRKDNPSGLGAGCLRLRSGRPDQPTASDLVREDAAVATITGDAYWIARAAASISSARARTRTSSVKFSQRTVPERSTKNSAGREMSRPSGPAAACSRPYCRITSKLGSDSNVKVRLALCCKLLETSGRSTLMATGRTPLAWNS
jgi:hypothetical protein